PQGAVSSRRPRVKVKITARPLLERKRFAGLRTGQTGVGRLPVPAGRVPIRIIADSAAESHAGFGAGHVVEPVAVEAADLDVFDRLRLDGKIGRLRRRNRRYTCRGAKEKTLQHFHLETPQVARQRLRLRQHRTDGEVLQSPKPPALPLTFLQQARTPVYRTSSIAGPAGQAIVVRRSAVVLARISVNCCPGTTVVPARPGESSGVTPSCQITS